MTRINKLAFAGMAIILVVVFDGGLWDKYAPLIRQRLIDQSYKVSGFVSWLDSPQFWIGVCFTLLCMIVGVAAFVLLSKDEFW